MIKAMNVMLQYVKQKLDERFHPHPHVHMHLIPRYMGDVENPKGGVRGVILGKQKY